jgi:Xaa-Pro aminopeptidase
MRFVSKIALVAMLVILNANVVVAGDARTDWDISCMIRADKFNYVLPDAMRDNNVDMWIIIDKGRGTEPLSRDFGDATSNGNGIVIFSDRGDEDCGVYDITGDPDDIRSFVDERAPQRIGVNFTTDTSIHPMEGRHLSNGLSFTDYSNLQATLGEPYASRLVSAEKLIAQFRGRRVALELVEFSRIGEITRKLLDRALSNEVITPGVTTLGDVVWWLEEQRVAMGLESGWHATVYVSPPDGIEIGNTFRVIQPGDIIQIDFGIGRNNFFTDIKRFAYVLREGETELPTWVDTAFDNAMTVRAMIQKNVAAGGVGRVKLDKLKSRVAQMGFVYTEEERASKVKGVEVNIGMHAAGNLGHDAGGALFEIYPVRTNYDIQADSIISLEFIVFTPVKEWDGNKVPVNIEENVLVTDHGIEWLHVPQNRPLLIR